MTRVDMAREKLQNSYDTELNAIIDEIAGTVTVREYHNYGSADVKYVSTKEESDLLHCVIYGAIYTFTHDLRADVQTIVDMAEITSMKLLEGTRGPQAYINCYDTVYIPLQRLFGVWG